MSTLDASVLIAHFNAADAHHRAATEFLLAHAGTRHWISPLNLAEVLVAHQRAGTLARATEAIADMGIAECAFPEGTARRLVEIRGRTGLKMPDCCLLLTAQQTETEVVSFDDRVLTSAAELGIDAVRPA